MIVLLQEFSFFQKQYNYISRVFLIQILFCLMILNNAFLR